MEVNGSFGLSHAVAKMRYLILSDIHSNYDALSAAIREENYDKVLFLGDIIGYGAEPDRCYDKFLDLGGIGVMGNHEFGVVHPETLFMFSDNARKGILYTMKNLKLRNLEHLKNLPFELRIEDFMLCHTMLDSPKDFNYVFPEEKYSGHLEDTFARMRREGIHLLFTGHTHHPCIFQEADGAIEVYRTNEAEFFLDDKYYVVNVGSVGQARNRLAKAQYAVYDSEERRISFKATEYDIEEAARKIRAAGLPDFLADRLFDGI